MWIPSHKSIDPNEFVGKLAKEAIDAEQSDLVCYSTAYSCVKGGLTCRLHPPRVQERLNSPRLDVRGYWRLS